MHTPLADLSIVFITYNRSHLLERCVKAIRQWPDLATVHTICSDDCSSQVHQQKIHELGFDQVLIPEKNGGLGRNNNKGLKAATTKYVLMLQDDCELKDPTSIHRALQILEGDPTIGIVRLSGDPAPFPLQKRSLNGDTYWVCDHTSEEYQRVRQLPIRTRIYSDQPHLRRASVHQDVIGYYPEGVSMEESEMTYEDKVDAQRDFYVAFLCDHEVEYFVHHWREGSFRTSKLRYRVDALIERAIKLFGLKNLPGYSNLRSSYRSVQAALVRMGILK